MSLIRSINSTTEILAELGGRLRAYRLQQNKTRAEVALESGLGSATIARAEAGKHPSLESTVRILRALGRIDALEAFLPEPLVSPIQLAELRGRPRQRARKPAIKPRDA